MRKSPAHSTLTIKKKKVAIFGSGEGKTPFSLEERRDVKGQLTTRGMDRSAD